MALAWLLVLGRQALLLECNLVAHLFSSEKVPSPPAQAGDYPA